MKHARFLIVAAALALPACETTGGVAPPPPAAVAIPAGPLSLGNWQSASAAATLTEFEQIVANRYAAGVAVDAAVADMGRNQFACAVARPAEDGRGAPATQVCRKTTTASGCTHTWQVHFFANGDANVVGRVRGLYDRRCGNDGLLGGPN